MSAPDHWWSQAPCAGQHEVFDGITAEAIAEAKSICHTCPLTIKASCLGDAAKFEVGADGTRFTMATTRAGMTPHERRVAYLRAQGVAR